MNSALISLTVLAAIFVAAALVGFRLERSPRPYPLTLLLPHIALFLLIAVGIGVCMNKIEEVTKQEMSPATMALCFAGPALIVCLLSGIVMICAKQKKRGWIITHKLATSFLALTLVAAGILTIMT
jgi:hypothetical protein